MINPLDELSDIYLGQISEADNSPEAIKARVMQHVRAIRYRARKEGDQLTKAYNDYMAGQAGISATEKSMVKERLGLTGGSQHQEGMAYGMYKGSGKPAGVMKDYLDKKAKKLEAEKKKQKPEYKNNPAFGDPSHHSNKAVKEGILVKAAQGVEAVGKKIDKADKAVTKATMNRVVKPAAKAIGKGAKKVGMAALRGTAGAVGGAVKGALKGASKGIKKGMREELLASGVFSEHEVTKLLWVEFDESREYSHNPEKYHDSEGHDKKLERDKPYRKRSKAARMADPERGINSPAFKKFMADRGM